MSATPCNTVVLNLVAYACVATWLCACGGELKPTKTGMSGAQAQFCFDRHIIDNSSSGADGVHVGDINGDSYPDVVSGWEQSAELKLYLHPGRTIRDTPSNWQAIDISANLDVSDIEDAAFVDINGDGNIDGVLSATEGKGRDSNRRIRLHRPPTKTAGTKAVDTGPKGRKETNTNAPDTLASTPWQGNVIHNDQPTDRFMKVRGAQIDNRHGADIVALSRDLFENPQDPTEITTYGGVFLYTAPPHEEMSTPAAWTRRRLADVHKGKSIELMDMDADQDLDILYSGARNVVWLENPSKDASGDDWASHWIGTASDLALCDVNVDGHMDIVATASRKEYPVVARWFEGGIDRKSRNQSWQAHDIRLEADLPSKIYQPDNFAVKSIACANLNPNSAPGSPPQIVITTSGSGFGIFLAIAGQSFSSDYTQPWRALPLTDYRWIMKYDNIVAADLDADGDMDLVTSEENEGLWLQGAGVLWYENRPCE